MNMINLINDETKYCAPPFLFYVVVSCVIVRVVLLVVLLLCAY